MSCSIHFAKILKTVRPTTPLFFCWFRRKTLFRIFKKKKKKCPRKITRLRYYCTKNVFLFFFFIAIIYLCSQIIPSFIPLHPSPTFRFYHGGLYPRRVLRYVSVLYAFRIKIRYIYMVLLFFFFLLSPRP